MAATDVSNQSIVDNLKQLGYEFPPDFDMSGAQNSTFKKRVEQHLRGQMWKTPEIGQGQYSEEAFEKGKSVAQALQVIPKDATPIQRLAAGLKAFGVNSGDMNKIVLEAQKRGGKGADYNEDDFEFAVDKVLGSSNKSVTQAYGIQGKQLPIFGDVQVDAGPLGGKPTMRPGVVGRKDPNAPPAPAPGAPVGNRNQEAAKLLNAPVGNRNQEAAKLLNKPAGTAKIPQTGGGGGGGGVAAPVYGTAPGQKLRPGAPQGEVDDWIRNNLGDYGWLYDVPGMRDLVTTAAREGQSPEIFTSKLHQTDYWVTTDKDAREWKQNKALDPETTRNQIKVKGDEIRKAAMAAGITIPDAEIALMAEDSLRFKWTPAEEQSAAGRFFKYDKDKLMGTALTTQQTLNQKARDWLVPMDDTTMQKWVTQVVTGEADETYFDGYMRDQAATLFPQLADPISRGIAPGLWMAPYATMAAQTLGINPDSIDLRESKWMKSINQVGPDGKRSAMNLSDWEDMLKTDDTYKWDSTDQGREHGATMARKLAGMFSGNA